MDLSTDRWAGAILMAIGAGLFWWAVGIDPGPGLAGLSPRTLPMALSLTVAGAGLVVVLRGGGRHGNAGQHFNPRVAGFAVLLSAYFFLFPSLDFRLGAWGFVLVAMVLMGARRPLQLIAFPPAAAMTIYAVFRHGFGVFLPVWG